MIVTVIPGTNINLLAFAAAGFASAELDKETDSFASWRGYAPPSHRGGKGFLAEAVDFAKYRYTWAGEHVWFM
jgi:transitional endoplasmic reticulum ATPase